MEMRRRLGGVSESESSLGWGGRVVEGWDLRLGCAVERDGCVEEEEVVVDWVREEWVPAQWV